MRILAERQAIILKALEGCEHNPYIFAFCGFELCAIELKKCQPLYNIEKMKKYLSPNFLVSSQTNEVNHFRGYQNLIISCKL